MSATTSELTPQELAVMNFTNAVTLLTDAVQKHLDETAQSRNYDNILSACTYATSIHAPFHAEGQACVEWRDAVWLYCYQVMYNVQNGLRALPTEAELLAEIPAIGW